MFLNRHPRSVHTAVFICVMCCWAVHASAQSRIDGAARHYERAVESLQWMSASDWQLVRTYLSDPTQASSEIVDLIDRAAPALLHIQRASREDVYYVVEMERIGPAGPNPQYVRTLGQLAQLCQASAMRKYEVGDGRAASYDLAAMYRMADHLAQGRMEVSTATAMAVFLIAEEGRRWSIEHGYLDAAGATTLFGAVRSLENPDPMYVADTLLRESDAFQSFLLQCFDSGDLATAERYLSLFRQGEVDLSGVGREHILEGAEFSRSMLSTIVETALDDPQRASEMLPEFKAELEARGYADLVPWMDQLRRRIQTLQMSRALVKDAADELRKIAVDAVEVEQLRNAAVLYLRAVEKLPNLADAESKEDAESVAAIKSEVMELVREASGLSHCDFASALGRSTVVHIRSILPSYLPAMSALLQMQLVEAERRISEGDADGAAGCAAVAVRMIRHLGEDAPILSSTVAYDQFQRVLETVIMLWEVRDTVSDEAFSALVESARLMRTSDPFGFMRSRIAARDDIERIHVRSVEDLSESQREERVRMIRTWREGDLVAAYFIRALRAEPDERFDLTDCLAAAGILAPLGSFPDVSGFVRALERHEESEEGFDGVLELIESHAEVFSSINEAADAGPTEFSAFVEVLTVMMKEE